MSDFDTSIILVTGAASGIGAATATRLAAGGAKKLILCDRNEDLLRDFAFSLPCERQMMIGDVADEAMHGRRADDYHAKRLDGQSATAALAHGPGITLYQSDGNLRPLDEIEADVIRLAIGHYRGRMTEVARRLGIGRSTLYRKLGELGIDAAA